MHPNITTITAYLIQGTELNQDFSKLSTKRAEGKPWESDMKFRTSPSFLHQNDAKFSCKHHNTALTSVTMVSFKKYDIKSLTQKYSPQG